MGNMGNVGWMGWATGYDAFRWRGWLPVPLYLGALAFADLAPGQLWEGVVGALLTAAGLSLRALARLELGRSSDTRRLHCHRLATDGIYAWTRNPIYVGNIAIAAGLAVLAGTDAVALVLAALLAVHYAHVVRAEERHLAAAFPERYAQYQREVPRFLPRAIPPAAHVQLERVGREGRIWVGIALALAALVALRQL